MGAVRAAVTLGRTLAARLAGSRLFSTTLARGLREGNVLDTLSSRSLLAQVTAPNSLRAHLQGGVQRSVYVGVDPSADSLHVGNLLPLLAALHFLEHGHRVVIIVGGATGSIGDPSGRDSERPALSPSDLARNISHITNQIHEFFDRARDLRTQRREQADVAAGKESSMAVTVVNNNSWYENMNVLTFLRDVGKLARIGTMMARDSVKSRLEAPGDGPTSKATGLSFTEFSYQLLQAYDFSVLNGAPWNCTVQLGGSDQMGNIMAGVDLIRRQKQREEITEGEGSDDHPAYGLTLPLLTTSSGAKFGKSAGNAVWLSPSKCSDYELYQYFYRSRDDEVELYLKTLTMLSLEEIESIMQNHEQQPALRTAQKALAVEVTGLVRGEAAVKRAQAATRILFKVSFEGLEAKEVVDAFLNDVRLCTMKRSRVVGADLVTVASEAGIVPSRSEAKRAITSGGFYLNNIAVKDAGRVLRSDDTICGDSLIILRRGRSEHRIIHLQD